MSNHIRDAFPGRRNSNGTLYALHAAFQKYGEENFSIRELEPNLSLGEARARERFYIRELGTYGGGRGRREARPGARSTPLAGARLPRAG